MRYGIFSDIHSNLQAMEAVLESYLKENIDKYFCVGDIVGYAANPIECLDWVRKLNPVIVAGNHDWAVADLFDMEYFNPIAKQAVLWTKEVLGEKEKSFLGNLPMVFEDENFSLVHGTLDNPQDFDYLTNEFIAKRTFAFMKNNLLFVGHTHVAGIFIEDGGSISYFEEESIKLTSNKRYIVNVGSIGQPRDGNPRPSFCIFDTNTKVLETRRINYNIQEAKKRIIEAGLPSYLAERLSIGH
ncbi:MAG: metallophosphoesterase family protein [Candidatus Omnitrophota bacterium]|nr:metallophosphoesterase family protein [Candidatus Omnitrophota bacterium]